jgi:hypothetical protein
VGEAELAVGVVRGKSVGHARMLPRSPKTSSA